MKLLVACLIICAVGCSAEYSKKQIQVVLKTGKECMQELSIPMEDNVIERVTYNKNPTLEDMKYLRCTMIKTGMLDAEDNYDIEKIVEFLGDRYDERQVRPVLVKCTKQDGSSVYERLLKLHQCFFNEKTFDI